MLPFKNLSLPPHSASQRVKTGTHNGKEQMDIIAKLHYLRKGGDHQTGHEFSPKGVKMYTVHRHPGHQLQGRHVTM